MDQDTLSQLLAAIQGREWYAVVGLGLMVVIAMARLAAPAIWDRIPQRLQWLPAVLGAGAVAAIDAWQSGVVWQQAIMLAVYAMVTAAGVAIGGWHTVKRLAGGESAPKLKPYDPAQPGSIAKPYDPTAPHAASEPPKGAA